MDPTRWAIFPCVSHFSYFCLIKDSGYASVNNMRMYLMHKQNNKKEEIQSSYFIQVFTLKSKLKCKYRQNAH